MSALPVDIRAGSPAACIEVPGPDQKVSLSRIFLSVIVAIAAPSRVTSMRVFGPFARLSADTISAASNMTSRVLISAPRILKTHCKRTPGFRLTANVASRRSDYALHSSSIGGIVASLRCPDDQQTQQHRYCPGRQDAA